MLKYHELQEDPFVKTLQSKYLDMGAVTVSVSYTKRGVYIYYVLADGTPAHEYLRK